MNKEIEKNGFKSKERLKLWQLPFGCSEINKFTIPNGNNIGKLISLSGKIVKTGTIKVAQRSKRFKCLGCKGYLDVVSDDSQFGLIFKPIACSHIIEGEGCASAKFTEELTENFLPVKSFSYYLFN